MWCGTLRRPNNQSLTDGVMKLLVEGAEEKPSLDCAGVKHNSCLEQDRPSVGVLLSAHTNYTLSAYKLYEVKNKGGSLQPTQILQIG